MTRPLAQQVADSILPDSPDTLGVAVSGGGDSMALLHLLHGCCRDLDISLQAITIDHGLRPEARAEAQMVEEFCRSLGVPHDTVQWRGWDGCGNLQNAARTARQRLIADWAQAKGIGTVALGHTADDQAETILMRLARQAGADGLSAMAPRREGRGILWLRPLLSAGRAELRSYLSENAIRWAEDPSNEDTAYDRIKARRALVLLEPLGIDAACLGAVASQMADVRAALVWQTAQAAKALVQIRAGAVTFDAAGWHAQPREIQRRLILAAIRWLTGTVYAPRRGAIGGLLEALQTGRAATVEGCHAMVRRDSIWIFREANAVRSLETSPADLWDGRWALAGPGEDACLQVRALGEGGLAQCPEWRDTGLPRDVLLSTPAVWRGTDLVAAPLAGLARGWTAEVPGADDGFTLTALSH